MEGKLERLVRPGRPAFHGGRLSKSCWNRCRRYQELQLTHLVEEMSWLWALGTKAERVVGDG